MSKIYEVRAEGNYVYSFGARRTRAEAEVLLRESEGQGPPALGPDYRLWIEEIDTSGLFEVPPRPTPRERYSTRVEVTSSISVRDHGYPRAVRVEILDGERVVMAYDRNYAMLQTFEPFRQGDRNFALISSDYTATSVVDLERKRTPKQQVHQRHHHEASPSARDRKNPTLRPAQPRPTRRLGTRRIHVPHAVEKPHRC